MAEGGWLTELGFSVGLVTLPTLVLSVVLQRLALWDFRVGLGEFEHQAKVARVVSFLAHVLRSRRLVRATPPADAPSGLAKLVGTLFAPVGWLVTGLDLLGQAGRATAGCCQACADNLEKVVRGFVSTHFGALAWTAAGVALPLIVLFDQSRAHEQHTEAVWRQFCIGLLLNWFCLSFITHRFVFELKWGYQHRAPHSLADCLVSSAVTCIHCCCARSDCCCTVTVPSRFEEVEELRLAFLLMSGRSPRRVLRTHAEAESDPLAVDTRGAAITEAGVKSALRTLQQLRVAEMKGMEVDEIGLARFLSDVAPESEPRDGIDWAVFHRTFYGEFSTDWLARVP